jgi:hypothetical protein
MICTRCQQAIGKEPYCRTKRGPHHFHDCTSPEEVDFGVEPYSPEDAVLYACGLLDVVKGEWGEEWSEHDQKVRAGLSRILSRDLLCQHTGPVQEGK